MKKLFFGLTILFGCYISDGQCVKEPEKILLWGDGPVYAPSSIQLIENSNVQFMHYEWGQSNVFTTVNGVTKETLIYFEARLLLAYYDSELKQYYFVGSIGSNEGYIAVFDEGLQLIESNEYAGQKFFSATVLDEEIVVGSDYKLYKIDRKSLDIKDKKKIDIRNVWCIKSNDQSLVCGGNDGALYVIDNDKVKKIPGMNLNEEFYDITIYKKKFLVISGESLNLISETGELKGRLLLNDGISAHFIDSLNNQIVMVGRNGKIQYYNIMDFTLNCEKSISGFELKEEPTQVIVPATDNNYSLLESRNIFNPQLYKSYNSKIKINDMVLDKNDDVFVGNAAGELILFDSKFIDRVVYKFKKHSVKGLVAGSNHSTFVWYYDGWEARFFDNKFTRSNKLYSSGTFEVVQAEFGKNYKHFFELSYISNEPGIQISLIKRKSFNYEKYGFKYLGDDKYEEVIISSIDTIIKIQPLANQLVGYLFNSGILQISEFQEQIQKIVSIAGIKDFAEYKNGWIALTNQGKLISITEKGILDDILTTNLSQPYKIAVSKNSKYLVVTNKTSNTVYDLKNKTVICEFNNVDSLNLERIEIADDGYVFTLSSSFPQTFIQPTGPKRYETRFISNVSFDDRTRYMYVFDSFGLLEVYQL